MNRLINLYNLLIIVFCLGSTLLLLGSPHHVDNEFLIATTSALIVFPLTAYSLRQTYRKSRWRIASIILLAVTCGITFYYINDLAFNGVDRVSSIIVYPAIIIVLSIAFIANIIFNRLKKKRQTTNQIRQNVS
jgi:Na+/proline symporter